MVAGMSTVKALPIELLSRPGRGCYLTLRRAAKPISTGSNGMIDYGAF